MQLSDSDFLTVERDGLKLERDEPFHRMLVEEASKRLQDRREWYEPGGKEIADHLSDDLQCPLKVSKRKRDQQQALNETSLEEWQIILFGLGYAWQDVVVGRDTEEHRWSKEHRLYYSPDGGLERPLEIKTTRRWPLKKEHRESGLGVEAVLLDNNPNWFKYMMGVMHLEDWREYWLSVFWLPNFWKTFRFTASEEAIAANWRELSERRMKRRAGEMTPYDRVDSTECGNCPYLAEEPCASTVPTMGGA